MRQTKTNASEEEDVRQSASTPGRDERMHFFARRGEEFLHRMVSMAHAWRREEEQVRTVHLSHETRHEGSTKTPHADSNFGIA